MNHLDEAKVTSAKHYGSKQENPEGFVDLQIAADLLGKTIGRNIIWGYDSDGFAEEFQQLLIESGVDEEFAEFPEHEHLVAAGWFKASENKHSAYYTKPGMVLVTEGNESAGVPSILFVVSTEA